MNEIVGKFLLSGDKSMPEMNLIHPEFTYIPYRLFTKNKGRIQKFKEAGDSRSKQDKACFQHDKA